MVFGWGKKKEPVPQVPQTKSITLSEVLEVASQLLELRQSQTVSEIRSCRDLIVPLLQDLTYIGRKLEEDDLNVDDIDKNIRIIVVRGKKQVIDIIKKDIVDLPDVSTHEDATLLHNTLSQILKKVGDALGRQTRVIHIFAKKYAGKLKEILAEINSYNAEIKKLLEHLENSRTSFADIESLLRQVSDMKTFNAGAKEKISSLNESIASCDSKITACTESIKSTKSSPKYADLLKQKDTLSKLQEKKIKLNTRVLDQFTKISRPLGRYEYASSLDKEMRMLLSVLIKSPSEALVPENRDAIISILENVKNGVASGSLSVKDRTKSLSQINETAGMIDGMISDISGHVSEQTRIEELIRDLTPVKLPLLEKELEKLTRNKTDAKSKILSLSDEVSANISKIESAVKDVGLKLREFSNTRYVISPEN